MIKIGYHNTVIDLATGRGQVATIAVFDTGTGNLSNIYSNLAGSAKDNPFTTDNFGRFDFFADPGNYDIQISGVDIETYKLEGITIAGFSLPPPGMHKITNMFFNPSSQKAEVIYDDNPAK